MKINNFHYFIKFIKDCSFYVKNESNFTSFPIFKYLNFFLILYVILTFTCEVN